MTENYQRKVKIVQDSQQVAYNQNTCVLIKADLTVTGDIGLSPYLHIIRGLYLKILLNFNEINQNQFIILLKKPRKYGILIYFNLFVLYKLSKNNSTLH